MLGNQVFRRASIGIEVLKGYHAGPLAEHWRGELGH